MHARAHSLYNLTRAGLTASYRFGELICWVAQIFLSEFKFEGNYVIADDIFGTDNYRRIQHLPSF